LDTLAGRAKFHRSANGNCSTNALYSEFPQQFLRWRIQQQDKLIRKGDLDQQRFESLKQKYSSVLSTIQREGIQLEHLHEENGKLMIAGKAPSTEANKV